MAVNIGPKIGIDGEKEYKKQIKEIVQETKTLDAKIKAAASSFDEEADSMKQNEKQTELLQKKKEALQKELDLMQEKMEALQNSEEDTTDAEAKLEEQMAKVETQIGKTNDALDDAQTKVENMQSPMGQLETLIQNQETELQQLQNEYANAWLEGDQQRCDDLAGKISSLNSELDTNRQRLDDAKQAAENAVKPTEDFAEAEGKAEEKGGPLDTILGKIGGNFSGIVAAITAGDLIGLISSVAEGFMDVVNGAREIDNACQEAEATLAVYTGLMGDELDALAEQANKAWSAIAGDQSREDVAATTGSLTTRFGDLGDSAESVTGVFASFGETFGVSSASVVNDIADMMQQMHLMSGNTEQDIATAVSILDQLTVACEGTDASYSDFTGTIQRNATAFQVMGMDTQDAINYMMQFEQAGSSASTAGQTLSKFIKSLDGDTQSAAAAWAQMQQVMVETEDPMEVLNAKIEGTNKTMETAFGANKAQELQNTFKAIAQGSMDFSAELANADTALSDVYASTITTQEGFGVMKNGFENITGLSGEVYEKFSQLSGMYDQNAKLGELLSEAYQKAATQQVKSAQESEKGVSNANKGITTSANQTKTQVGQSASAMASDFEKSRGRIDTASNGIVRDLNAIKENANVWIAVHGQYTDLIANKSADGSVRYTPHTYTFAKAYDQAMVLSHPTLFGLIGGDRAGNEIVVGESHLLDMIGQTVKSAFGYVPAANNHNTTNNYAGTTVNVYGAPGQDVRELANIIEQKISRNVNRRAAAW